MTTNAVVARPWLWRVLRAPLRLEFDLLARHWDSYASPDGLAPYEAALDALESAPARVLDVGTGTGRGAFAVAARFPNAEIVGVDVAARMLEEARAKVPPELARRLRFEEADGAALPYANGEFDLVTLANMIPFFDELARVVAPRGAAIVSFSSGADTPIYVPFDRLRAELGRRGFTQFAEFSAGRGTALLARKREAQ